MRFAIFEQNIRELDRLIEKHNSTNFGVTKFFDITDQEVHVPDSVAHKTYTRSVSSASVT
jgi:hypothetical protein